MASISQVVARRTQISPDEAFLTGLLHGIGRLYFMVRAVGKPDAFNDRESFMDLVSGWHPSIGKSVLENWGFAEEMAAAVGNQAEAERDRKRKREVDLTDIPVASIVLGEALKLPNPRVLDIAGIDAFATIGLSAEDCVTILTHTEYQLESLQGALGC